MPLDPITVGNPYGLPPLEGGVSFTDEERRRLGMRTSSPAPPQTTEEKQLEMVRSIAQAAAQPGADQGALSRAASAAAMAVPMAEWKPPAEPLPVSRKEHVRTVLESRERQLRSLEQFASDPKNPVSQDEVARVRDQIEAEAQRALANATLPSPVSMYEQLVEDESPEIYRAKHKEMLMSLPGFNEKWMASVSFDPETNEPVYPKWMEKPLEAAMSKAMGVGVDEQAEKAREAAADFALDQLKRAEPNLKDYDDDIAAFDADHAAWENKMRAHFVRFNPEAAKQLPTFAEEQGFVEPSATPAAAPVVAPVGNQGDVEQLRMRFEATGAPAVVVQTADDLRNQIASGDITPDDVVIVSTPNGAVAVKLERDGKLRQVGRFSSRQ